VIRLIDIKDELRSRLGEYVAQVTRPSRRAGKNMFVCPLCGSGSKGGRDSDGAFHLSGDRWYCHACQKGGDIFTLYAEINQLDTVNDFPEINTGLAQALGVTQIDSARRDFTPERKEVRQEVKQINPERLTQIETFASQLAGSPAETYLKERGFSDEIIQKFKLGYDKAKNAVVIPYPGTDYFTERLINPGDRNKYDNLPGEAPTFMIKQSDQDFYFVTEGQLDALSMIQAGAKNVIASHYPSKIEKLIGEIKIDGAVIVADHDEPGEKIAQSLTDLFNEKKIKSLVVYPPEGFKDSNDVLRSDPKKLTELLSQGAKQLQEIEAPATIFKIVNVSEYLESDAFGADIEYFRKYKNRKTGFSNIDKYLTLYPGLACLTGATSLGKTSFSVQLADQLIEKGETVLYFSLEQLPIELVTKSLARKYYLAGGHNFNNIDIKNGASDDTLISVKKAHAQTARRFNIIECDFTVSADMIVEYVEEYIKANQVKPIVIVDYLQIISAPEGQRMDDRERIDDAVKKLKRLSKDNELFVLMISNMARSTYREKIGEDSFKESGLIEYTCDYLFGLQLAILEDEKFFTKKGNRGGEKETLKSEKQDKIDEASEAIPKEVVFKAMKNRNGRKVFRAFFKYRPDYDLFEVDNNSKYDKDSPTYQFEEIDDDENPFENDDISSFIDK